MSFTVEKPPSGNRRRGLQDTYPTRTAPQELMDSLDSYTAQAICEAWSKGRKRMVLWKKNGGGGGRIGGAYDGH